MKVMSIFGTRPEMIKLQTTLKKLDQLPLEHVMVHTGQNFTPELKDFFFRDLELREPDYQLQINTKSYALEVADVILKADELFDREKPDALLILGDTYSGLSIMPAKQRGIKIFHMEAGLRAYDRRMPEQRNRMLIDHLSDILLPFYQGHRENLIRENIHPAKIFVTGNPTFEVLHNLRPQIDESTILETLGLSDGDYIVATAHRSENVDDPRRLNAILTALEQVGRDTGAEVIYPMHPRTRSKLGPGHTWEHIRIMDPLGFLDFNKLLMHCRCILSDSGTAPEEAYYYERPCVSLRDTTERPESVEGGANIVAGLEPENIVQAVQISLTTGYQGRYDLERDASPSNVVVNAIASHITNYF